MHPADLTDGCSSSTVQKANLAARLTRNMGFHFLLSASSRATSCLHYESLDKLHIHLRYTHVAAPPSVRLRLSFTKASERYVGLIYRLDVLDNGNKTISCDTYDGALYHPQFYQHGRFHPHCRSPNTGESGAKGVLYCWQRHHQRVHSSDYQLHWSPSSPPDDWLPFKILDSYQVSPIPTVCRHTTVDQYFACMGWGLVGYIYPGIRDRATHGRGDPRS